MDTSCQYTRHATLHQSSHAAQALGAPGSPPPLFTNFCFVSHVFSRGYIFSLVICSMAAIFCSSIMSLRETISWIRPRKLGCCWIMSRST